MLSQLNKHELALNHAMSAVILLQEMMLRRKLDPASAQEDDLDDVVVPGTSLAGDKVQNKDKVAVLAIAYHNMGVEQEFLRSYPAAILSYKKAVNFASKWLGEEDGITQNLRSVFENAKNEVSCFISKSLISNLFSWIWPSSKRVRKVAARWVRRRARSSTARTCKVTLAPISMTA